MKSLSSRIRIVHACNTNVVFTNRLTRDWFGGKGKDIVRVMPQVDVVEQDWWS
jgi:hypothetical protein